MSNGKILIYGAYGYSGRLAAQHAEEFGVHAILGGRNSKKLDAVANETGLPTRVFDLATRGEFDDQLQDIDVVLHCAGPFSHTYDPMVKACLRTQTHYIDITGEIDVIEGCARLDKEAHKAGVVLMPATGFDVVPTDCMARYLAEQLPDATSLELAFVSDGGLSHGTASTMIEQLGTGSLERQDGLITEVPLAQHVENFDFGRGATTCVSIPWGDVASAYYTTAIPNITTYTAVPENAVKWMKATRFIGPVLRSSLVRSLLQKRVDNQLVGPDRKDREQASSSVYGRVQNDHGKNREALLHTPDGYTLTYMSSLTIASRLADDNETSGFHTPAGLYGADFILEFPQTERIDIA